MKTLAAYLFVDLFVALPIAFAMIRAKYEEDGERSAGITVGWIIISVLWPLWISLFAIVALLFPKEFPLSRRRHDRGDDP